jgi:hypothetical protein
VHHHVHGDEHYKRPDQLAAEDHPNQRCNRQRVDRRHHLEERQVALGRVDNGQRVLTEKQRVNEIDGARQRIVDAPRGHADDGNRHQREQRQIGRGQPQSRPSADVIAEREVLVERDRHGGNRSQQQRVGEAAAHDDQQRRYTGSGGHGARQREYRSGARSRGDGGHAGEKPETDRQRRRPRVL